MRIPRPAFLLIVLVLGPLGRVAAQSPVVPCPPNVPGGVICLSGSISDGNGGPLLSGQVYHVDGSITVPVGATLTAQDGAILKFFATGLDVRGTLVDQGAVYTSQRDDSRGGDTNGDGAASQPARGDWPGLDFFDGADASIVSGAEIVFANTGVDAISADIALNAVEIKECSLVALDLRNSSRASVTGCDFSDSRRAVDGVPLAALPAFSGNTASNNTLGDYLRIGEGTVDVNTTIGPANALNGDGVFVSCTVAGIEVEVGRTLQLDPGCIVKLDTAGLGTGCNQVQGIDVRGTLIARGVAFTSLADDFFGGDTNADGSQSLPQPGDWSRIKFFSGADASRLETVFVHYGSGTAGVLELDGADVTLDTVEVKSSGSSPLSCNDSFPAVTGCSFVDSPGVAVRRLPLGAVAGFDGNTASGNAGGDHLLVDDFIALTGSVVIGPSNTLNASGLVVYEATSGSPQVPAGTTLTLEAGTVFKYGSGKGMIIAGTMLAQGSAAAGIVLTSLADDGVLGDTNGDAGASVPARGDWDGLRFLAGSGATVLEFVQLRYAGAFGPHAGIHLTSADITVRDSTIADCTGEGIDLTALPNQSSFPTIEGCTFTGNSRFPLGGVEVEAVPALTGNSAAGHGIGDHVQLGAGTISTVSSPTTIGPDNSMNGDGVFELRHVLTVSAGNTLTLLPGTIVKATSTAVPKVRLDVLGTLIAGGIGDVVVFTSSGDDSIGGDTNGDGGASVPAPGDWGGLRLKSDTSVLDGVEVRLAGSPGVDLFAADVTMSQVTITQCSGAALDLSGNSFPQVTGSHFSQCGIAVDDVPIEALPGFDGNTAALNAGDYQRVTDGDVSSSLLLDPIQALNGGPIVMVDGITVRSGVTMTVAGGTIFKFDDGFADVRVTGTLDCVGTPSVPVVFTSIHDDTSGDTNKNGAATAPAPGDWQRILFDPGSDASRLEGALVRYASGAAVSLSSADITIEGTTITNSAGSALNLNNNSFPQVARSAFDDNAGRAVVRAPLAALPGFLDNTATGNGVGDYILVEQGSLSGPAPVVVSRSSSLNDDGVFGCSTALSVLPGAALELRQGVIFKFLQFANVQGNGTLDVEGTGFEPVVMTSIHDDDFGGDSNKNGAATLPAPGDGPAVRWPAGAGPSTVRGLVVRYSAAVSAIDIQRDDVTICSSRVDHAQDRGMLLARLAGDAMNLVAFGCGGNGIELGSSGVFDLVHATAASNGGAGIFKAGNHTGVAVGCIAFANTGAAGNFGNFGSGDLFFCNGDSASAGSNGNIDVDPSFVDVAGGVLTLDETSPCLDAADFVVSLTVKDDHEDRSRILDHDLDGTALPDMGAFERAAYEMGVSGQPRIGFSQTFTVTGEEPGFAVLLFGILDGEAFFSPYGFELAGAPANVLPAATVLVGQGFTVTYPDFEPLVGIPFGLQYLTLASADPTKGSFTSVYRARFRR